MSVPSEGSRRPRSVAGYFARVDEWVRSLAMTPRSVTPDRPRTNSFSLRERRPELELGQENMSPLRYLPERIRIAQHLEVCGPEWAC